MFSFRSPSYQIDIHIHQSAYGEREKAMDRTNRNEEREILVKVSHMHGH